VDSVLPALERIGLGHRGLRGRSQRREKFRNRIAFFGRKRWVRRRDRDHHVIRSRLILQPDRFHVQCGDAQLRELERARSNVRRRLLPQEVTAIAFLIIVAASRDRDPLSLTAETLLLPITRAGRRVPSTIRFDGPISLGGIEARNSVD
jgi:hypothetical protein